MYVVLQVSVVPTINVVSDSYNMDHQKRGYALIINNENFRSSLRREGFGNRHGTMEDERNLKTQLKRLGTITYVLSQYYHYSTEHK